MKKQRSTRMNDYDNTWTENMLVLDRTKDTTVTDISYPFALDELLCRQTGEGGPSVFHLWSHPRAFVMGARDSRLPGASKAANWLENEGYEVLVRHSGGAAVPLDAGVINLSLIMPMSGIFAYGFRDDFERMYALIRRTVEAFHYKIDKGEVQGSYCPGEYDLHIDGFKFCGIAQRRQKNAMIIQAFVVVEGSGAARAERVKAFYDIAGVGAEPGAYPIIVPASMRSLQESSDVGFGGTDAFASAVVRTLGEFQATLPNSNIASNHTLRLPEPQTVLDMCEQLRQRYPILAYRMEQV
jgi:octanoyl-[GcvH]:protein N-octanoyltransferase